MPQYITNRDELKAYIALGGNAMMWWQSQASGGGTWVLEVPGHPPVRLNSGAVIREAKRLIDRQNGMPSRRYFSPMVDNALLRWLNGPSWDIAHPNDAERFYRFLRALVEYRRRYARDVPWQEGFSAVLARAARDIHQTYDEDFLRERVERLTRRAAVIFDYEDVPFRE